MAVKAFNPKKALASALFCAVVCASLNRPTALGIALVLIGFVCYVLGTKSDLSYGWRIGWYVAAVNAYLFGIGPANRPEWFSPFDAEKLLPILGSIAGLDVLWGLCFFIQWKFQKGENK